MSKIIDALAVEQVAVSDAETMTSEGQKLEIIILEFEAVGGGKQAYCFSVEGAKGLADRIMVTAAHKKARLDLEAAPLSPYAHRSVSLKEMLQ